MRSLCAQLARPAAVGSTRPTTVIKRTAETGCAQVCTRLSRALDLLWAPGAREAERDAGGGGREACVCSARGGGARATRLSGWNDHRRDVSTGSPCGASTPCTPHLLFTIPRLHDRLPARRLPRRKAPILFYSNGNQYWGKRTKLQRLPSGNVPGSEGEDNLPRCAPLRRRRRTRHAPAREPSYPFSAAAEQLSGAAPGQCAACPLPPTPAPGVLACSLPKRTLRCCGSSVKLRGHVPMARSVWADGGSPARGGWGRGACVAPRPPTCPLPP